MQPLVESQGKTGAHWPKGIKVLDVSEQDQGGCGSQWMWSIRGKDMEEEEPTTHSRHGGLHGWPSFLPEICDYNFLSLLT